MFVVITDLSGRPELGLGFVFVSRMFALALPQPFAGMLADRYSRKWLMVASNVASAVCAFALLTVHTADDLPLFFVLIISLMVLHAVYIPVTDLGTFRDPGKAKITIGAQTRYANVMLRSGLFSVVQITPAP